MLHNLPDHVIISVAKTRNELAGLIAMRHAYSACAPLLACRQTIWKPVMSARYFCCSLNAIEHYSMMFKKQQTPKKYMRYSEVTGA